MNSVECIVSFYWAMLMMGANTPLQLSIMTEMNHNLDVKHLSATIGNHSVIIEESMGMRVQMYRYINFCITPIVDTAFNVWFLQQL